MDAMETPPPSFAEYPRMRIPQVKMYMIGDAFRIFMADWKMWVMAALPATILFGGYFVYSIIQQFVAPRQASGDPLADLRATLVQSLAQSVISTIAWAICLGGMARMAIRKLDGYEIRPSDAFSLNGKGLSICIAYILTNVITLFGICACYVGAIIAMGLSYITIPIILMQRVGPIEGISRSWGTLKAQLWPAAGLSFLMGLIYGLGYFTILGQLATIPAQAILMAIVYREFFPLTTDSSVPTVDVPMIG